MKQLLELFPFIQQTTTELEEQNKLLNKVTLIGKINALHVAANLFEFTDKTSDVFDKLKVELIEALLSENLNQITNELNFKARTAIDILVRNLFERTADIGFFATDKLIEDYLTCDSISDKTMLNHLNEYASKYSVYNEILIFDLDGNVKINMNQNNIITSTQDEIIMQSLQSNDYIERFAYSDIFKGQKKTLMYTQKILHDGKSVGVLCLCFKFEDEMQSIFKNLAHSGEKISISYGNEILISNSNTIYETSYTQSEYTVIKSKYIAVNKKTAGYQNYMGLSGWYATAMIDAKATSELKVKDEAQEVEKEHKSLLSEKLNLIIENANDIIDDISDVIINGEIIASKKKVYVLTPILENFRNISAGLLSSINNSIQNLEYVVEEGYVHDVKMASHLAIDIMDRNLYERANDSRWWALTPLFIKELSLATPNIEELHNTLHYINTLYTVYTNIFIYDKNKMIIAASSDESIVGEKLNEDCVSKTLSNKDSQKYYVSEFEKTSFYAGNATYIYCASIIDEKNIVGGIGVVFDSTPEFEAMLIDSFPRSRKGFMCFIDENKKIIATSKESLNVLDTLDIDEKFINVKGTYSLYEYITFEEVEYIVSSVVSQGYREYKTVDNYKNDIYCVTFIEI